MSARENVFRNAYLQIGINDRRPVRLGFEASTIVHHGRPYLLRLIAYFGATLRLHRFVRGDDDRAPHDHPWWFITFPFTSYVERYWLPCPTITFTAGMPLPGEPGFACDSNSGISYGTKWVEDVRVVKAWRFHFRERKFRHFVVGRADGKNKPFWTLVFTGPSHKGWGFWPTPDTFVPWRQWT